MKIQSRPFGEVDIDESKIITIQGGMFGFEGYERFVLIGVKEQLPFEWLQCVDEPSIAFVVIRPEAFMPQYQLQISEADRTALGVKTESELLTYIVCVIPDDMRKITVNLKGPVVVNSPAHQARQVISLVEAYTVRYPLFDSQQKVAGAEGGS